MRINLIDVDGTLCPSIFNNERLKNDNNNTMSPDFLKDLANVKPYQWFDFAANDFIHHVNVIVTGRLPQHEELTKKWFENAAHFSPVMAGYVSVPWDDTKATREASYNDYVIRKVDTLTTIGDAWLEAATKSNIKAELHVYEDDGRVLADVSGWYEEEGRVSLHVVDDKGEVHDYA